MGLGFSFNTEFGRLRGASLDSCARAGLDGTSVTSAILGRISASKQKVLGMVCGSWEIVGARDGELEGISYTSVMLVRVSASKEKALGMVCWGLVIVGARDEVLEGTRA